MTLDGATDAELGAWLDDVTARAIQAYPATRVSWSYGPSAEQVVDLWGNPEAAVVVVSVHGGYFAGEYDRSVNEPVCRRLVAEGYAVANVEYRRTGSSPDPLDSTRDVRAAVRSVSQRLDGRDVVLVGHSAGGYLALTGAADGMVRGSVALAPVLLLRDLFEAGVDDGALGDWIGSDPGTDPDTWHRLLPEQVGYGRAPAHLLHGALDRVVPLEHSVEWVGRQPGDQIRLDTLDGTGHYEFLDPDSSATDVVVVVIRDLLARPTGSQGRPSPHG